MPNDDDKKSASSESDDSSADDAAGPNRNHPALTRQATGKGESRKMWKKETRMTLSGGW